MRSFLLIFIAALLIYSSIIDPTLRIQGFFMFGLGLWLIALVIMTGFQKRRLAKR